MNKLSKYIAIATLASTVTISAPIHTYACESHTKDNHNQTTQHQNDPNLVTKCNGCLMVSKFCRSEGTLSTGIQYCKISVR